MNGPLLFLSIDGTTGLAASRRSIGATEPSQSLRRRNRDGHRLPFDGWA
jgi:hypothetical protein